MPFARQKSRYSITASARASNFQNGRFLSSQWFPDKATSAQTNSRAPSVVLNQIDDLWSPSTFHRARDRRSSCRILACHPVTHAKLRLSCGAHPRSSRRPGHFVWQAIELRSARAARPGKQGPRQCLEVWSCLPLRRMAESSAADFTVGKIQKDWGQRVAKMYGQQKRNIIHTSSTAYEQDHSAAAPPTSLMNSRRFIRSPRRRWRVRCALNDNLRRDCPRPLCPKSGHSEQKILLSALCQKRT